MISIEKEKDFQAVFTKLIRQMWWWIYKIPDIWNVRKPFDTFISYKWNIKAVELKVAPTSKTNIKRLLKEHQIGNLKELYPNAFVLVYFKKEKASSLYQMKPNGNLEEIIHLKRLFVICDYLL